jgi:hypothetical protein
MLTFHGFIRYLTDAKRALFHINLPIIANRIDRPSIVANFWLLRKEFSFMSGHWIAPRPVTSRSPPPALP